MGSALPVTEGLPPVAIGRRTGSEEFHRAGQSLGFDLLGFWQWASSDLISNSLRGVLAEFIVARALAIPIQTRAPWAPCDLCTADGLRIEVKSSAYLQSWFQKKLSRPAFNVRQTRSWDAETDVMDLDPRYQADVFVFALLKHQEKPTLDPLDVTQWEFFVLRSSVLAAKCPTQKSIGLPSLIKLGAFRAAYDELRQTLDLVMQR